MDCIFHLRNKTCFPCLHSLVKTEANVWENSRADQWKSETQSKLYWKHSLVDQSKRTYYPNYLIKMTVSHAKCRNSHDSCVVPLSPSWSRWPFSTQQISYWFEGHCWYTSDQTEGRLTTTLLLSSPLIKGCDIEPAGATGVWKGIGETAGDLSGNVYVSTVTGSWKCTRGPSVALPSVKQ